MTTATFTEADLDAITPTPHPHQDILDFICARGEQYYHLINQNISSGRVTADEVTAFSGGETINLLVRYYNSKTGQDQIDVYPVPRAYIFDQDGSYEEKILTLIRLQHELGLPKQKTGN